MSSIAEGSTMSLTYSEAKQCIQDLERSGFEDLLKQCGEDVIKAALECDVQPSDIEEAYQGKYNSDEDFAQQTCEDLGEVPKDFPAYIHIDWEWTAREIMMDYSTANGHYFRSL